MQICKLEHIHKDYRMGEIVSPLKDITLTVNGGDFIAVEGPSGIGKSTLLYVMGTLLQSNAGSYYFAEQDVSRMSDNQRSELRAKKIGFLFQDSTLIQALTLRENLIFSQGVGGKKDMKQIDGLLERFGLAARALLHKPALILADEPTNDLDEHWSVEIIKALQEEAARGAGVVMVTHNSQWAKFATRRCRLEDGKLVDIE